MARNADEAASRRRRIVILGGGPSGAAAAYWLTAPEQNDRYAVTLYSQGWRLGGKCASGRNADLGERIEEHGLHMLMGCYQNAFATLRAVYRDWRALKPDPESPFQTWKDAFEPQRLVSMMEGDGPGDPPAWSPWNFPFLPLPGEPGDGPLAEDGDAPMPTEGDHHLILRLLDLLKTHAVHPGHPDAHRDLVHRVLDGARAAIEAFDRGFDHLRSDFDAAAREVRKAIREDLQLIEDAFAGQEAFLSRLATLTDLGLAVVRGYLQDIFLRGPDAYDALNTMDFRDWLRSHGASEATVGAAPVRAFYDLTFAAVGGVEQGLASGSIGAGVALKAQMEIVLGYRNAPLWKMASGMGDTVFTPFYDVLTARGVDVRLFSRVTGLRPAGDGRVGEIDILTQAVTADGSPYRPFKRVRHLDCWPNQPFWGQLADGERLKAAGVNFEMSECDVAVGPPTTLHADRDFDLAIVALPPEALKRVAPALAAASEAWRYALEQSASVATQSLQLWTRPTTAALGWTYGPTVLTAFAEPYSSWGDMSQVIRSEAWAAGTGPGSIAYFCGCLAVPKGPTTPAAMKHLAAHEADRWLDGNIAAIWPKLGPDPVAGPKILSRYVVANFDVSDQYVQTPAGPNVASRFDPGAPAGFANLYAVGDWTRTRFSGGCFESAIESGMRAARGISGFPQAIKTA